jgi:hypothetical protein
MSSSIQFVLCALAIWVMTSSVIPRSTILMADRGGFDSGRMFDKYGVLSLKEENDHLDNLAIQLRKEPRSKAYVVIYDGSEDHVGDLRARACRAIRRLISRGHVDPKQVVAVMIGGGHREEFTVELWVWPIEASDDLPRFQLGVKDEEVSIIRGSENVKRCGRKRS